MAADDGKNGTRVFKKTSPNGKVGTKVDPGTDKVIRMVDF